MESRWTVATLPVSRFVPRFEDIWDGVWHRPGTAAFTIGRHYTPDFSVHISSLPEPLGAADFAEMVLIWQQAFPGGRRDILDLIARDEKLWCYWVAKGTHSGSYLGVPATGRHVTYHGVDIYRFREDRIAECWTVPDLFSLLRQLGAIPG